MRDDSILLCNSLISSAQLVPSMILAHRSPVPLLALALAHLPPAQHSYASIEQGGIAEMAIDAIDGMMDSMTISLVFSLCKSNTCGEIAMKN